MEILKKDKWWVWLIGFLISASCSAFILSNILNVLKKDEWYSKWYLWLIGGLFIIPLPIMFVAFIISMTSKCAEKLDVWAKEFYTSPYAWIMMIVIPIVGWASFIVFYFYMIISILINLHNGYGEALFDKDRKEEN